MFEALTDRLQNLFSGFRRHQVLTESNIAEAIEEMRLALLDADVHADVAAALVQRVRSRSVGTTVLKAIAPDQQFAKLVHDELVAMMGKTEVPLALQGNPSVIMLCGLQGAGKTTTCAKLARYISKKEPKKRIAMVACDLQRPAAIEQLQKLGKDLNIPVFAFPGETDVLRVVRDSLERAKAEGVQVLLIDTAGRLHLDVDLMGELQAMHKLLQPQEVLFVAHAAMGQDAVRTASEFSKCIPITGSVLTMLDGNARAGAAISIREVTQKPLKFEGIGEKVDDLQAFHPQSMADRILGMGDTINLVRRAQEHRDAKEDAELAKKMRKAEMNYEDFLKQMGMIQKMGSMSSLLKMIPGMSGVKNLVVPEKEMNQANAIIWSMTPTERKETVELSVSRRKRIASGSGTTLDDVNRLVKRWKQMKQFCKDLPRMNQLMGRFGVKNPFQ